MNTEQDEPLTESNELTEQDMKNLLGLISLAVKGVGMDDGGQIASAALVLSNKLKAKINGNQN